MAVIARPCDFVRHTDLRTILTTEDYMKPAEVLEGMTLDNGWLVGSRIDRAPGATGGLFSVPYLVERRSGNDSEQAFLKALDFSGAESLGLPFVDALAYMSNAFIFERDLVMQCAGRKMSNVVRGIDQGEVEVDASLIESKYQALSKVSYLVFEVADGDVRSALALSTNGFDTAWKLRVLHGVSNGLRQLHQAGISHQDLKASNVMRFENESKIGDLGRSSPTGGGGLFDDLPIAGDMTYAPPELLYRELQSDQAIRRRSADCYQLGSLLVFLVSGSGLTPLISAAIDPAFHWRTWPNDYRNVLPHVREAFNRVLSELVASEHDVDDGVWKMIRELSDPDPLLRGNPRAAGLSRLSMDRYVSVFDRLAQLAELDLKRVLSK